MIHNRNIIIPIVAIVLYLQAGCQHNSATMQQLAHIDSMVYHQHEQEAHTSLASCTPSGTVVFIFQLPATMCFLIFLFLD